MTTADEVCTFMFTDIQGSTRLWEEHEQEMAAVLARHDQVIHTAVEANGGSVFKHMGDGIVASFPSPISAVRAAIRVQLEFSEADWGDVGELKARMGIHMGLAARRGSDFFGRTVNRCARLMGCAHGGQIVISAPSAEHIAPQGEDDWTLQDLGVHQLRDLSNPERVLQVCHPLLDAEFPTLKTVAAVPRVLPSATEAFMGRERELREMADLIVRSRLITITGPGGVGKTQLALASGEAAVREFPDGVWFISIRGDLSAEELAGQIADRVGVGPIADNSEISRLTTGLGAKRALLVIDNAEDSLSSAKEVVSELLQGCPGLLIIVTSRELLKVRGEQALVVGPLSVADSDENDPERARRSPAVRLFEERARQASPDFAVTATNVQHVVSICERLDGLPLAVELAAAQMGTFDPETLAARIGGRVSLIDDRDRTLAAIVDWSYTTLTNEQQRLFRRLAVFAGGFGLAAAEKICADEPELQSANGASALSEFDIMPLLSDLVSKSVIVVERDQNETRFRMLALLREYAIARLNEADERTAIRDAHLSYFQAVADEAQRGLRGPREAVWAEVMSRSFNNIRAAFEWAVESNQADRALAVLAGAQRFARQRLRYEMLSWADDVLKIADEDTPGYPNALAIKSGAAAIAGAYDESLRLGAQASALDEAHGGHWPFEAYKSRVITSILSQRIDSALTIIAQAQDAADRLDRPDEALEFLALRVLANSAGGRTDIAGADAAVAVERARELRNPSLLAFSLYAAGSVESDMDTSLALLDEAADFADRVGNRYVLANAIQMTTWRQASVGADVARRTASAASFAQVIEHWYRVGNWSSFEMSIRMCVEALAGTVYDSFTAALAGWLLRGERRADDLIGSTERFATSLETLRERMGDDAVNRQLRAGQMMDATDLIALCREHLTVVETREAAAVVDASASAALPPV